MPAARMSGLRALGQQNRERRALAGRGVDGQVELAEGFDEQILLRGRANTKPGLSHCSADRSLCLAMKFALAAAAPSARPSIE
jgi:hypothetical protein